MTRRRLRQPPEAAVEMSIVEVRLARHRRRRRRHRKRTKIEQRDVEEPNGERTRANESSLSEAISF